MKIISVLILVVLSLFTIWQAYTLVKKIIEKKKCKGTQVENSNSTIKEEENIDKGDENSGC